MNLKPVDLEPLRWAIRQYKMMEIWGDSITEISADERRERSRSRALDARDSYVKLMQSPRNNGSAEYQFWAIKKSLGLRTSSRHTAQPTGGKNWKAWG